jgi:clan AA aspartic protease (TIGR02281 family)
VGGAAARDPAWARAAACALLLAASGATAAESWRQVAERPEATVFLDVAAIEQAYPGAPVYAIRTQQVFRAPAVNGATRAVLRSLVDCESNREVVVETEWFDARGRSRGRTALDAEQVRAQRQRQIEGPRVEYSARLAPLCTEIAAQAARGAVRQRVLGEGAETAAVRSVPLVRGGGVYGLRVSVNGSTSALFVVDSGASMVTLPQAMAVRLREAGSLRETDVLRQQRSLLADGREATTSVVRLRSVEIDGLVLRDVEAAVLPGEGIPLLGQSFLGRLRHWSLNRRTQSFDFVP